MSKIVSFILPFASVLFLFSCRTNYCNNTFISPVFVGFSSKDLDTIVIRKFKPGTNFQIIEDSSVVFATDTGRAAPHLYTSNDTTIVILSDYMQIPKYLLPGKDWQVYLPSTNLTISLSNIVSPQLGSNTCFGDCMGCTNPINSIALNGQVIQPVPGRVPVWGGDCYFVYIH